MPVRLPAPRCPRRDGFAHGAGRWNDPAGATLPRSAARESNNTCRDCQAGTGGANYSGKKQLVQLERFVRSKHARDLPNNALCDTTRSAPELEQEMFPRAS